MSKQDLARLHSSDPSDGQPAQEVGAGQARSETAWASSDDREPRSPVAVAPGDAHRVSGRRRGSRRPEPYFEPFTTDALLSPADWRSEDDVIDELAGEN